MAVANSVAREIQQAAIDRVRTHLTRHDDSCIFTLVELSVCTAMDPETVDAVMSHLADDSSLSEEQFTIEQVGTEYGERRWRVRRP